MPHSHKRWREKFCLVQTSPADKPKNCLLTYESVILQLTFDTEVGCQWIFSTKDTAGLSKRSTYSQQAKVYILQYFFLFFNTVNLIFYWISTYKWINFFICFTSARKGLVLLWVFFFLQIRHTQQSPKCFTSNQKFPAKSVVTVEMIVISIETFHIWSIL